MQWNFSLRKQRNTVRGVNSNWLYMSHIPETIKLSLLVDADYTATVSLPLTEVKLRGEVQIEVGNTAVLSVIKTLITFKTNW